MNHKPPASQIDKFKAAARELEADDDPKRFEERLGELVKHKPVLAEPNQAGSKRPVSRKK